MSQGTSKFIPQYFRKGSKVIVWDCGSNAYSNIEDYGYITADGIYWGRWFESRYDASRERDGWITEVNGKLYPCYKVSNITKQAWQDAVDGVIYHDNHRPNICYAIERVIQ